MISFHFEINDSFLGYSMHPITIPKTQVDYKKMEFEGFARGDLTIIFPKGERIRGHMYYGKSGFGRITKLGHTQIRIYRIIYQQVIKLLLFYIKKGIIITLLLNIKIDFNPFFQRMSKNSPHIFVVFHHSDEINKP